jgi:ribosomal protein L11 methyltransferase
MSSHYPGNDCRRSERLYVYECRGEGLPKQEPIHPRFLGIWSEPPYYYLFFSEPAMVFVADWILGQSGWTLEGHYDLDYAQWQQVPHADQHVGPFVISLTGRPDGIPADGPRESGLLITLDPGLVFGSGLHPTSRGALFAIAHWFTAEGVRRVIDFGTGTGILALACAACGAERVLAVDCNPMAVRAALRNVGRNRFGDKVIGIAASTLRVIQSSEDLLVMNIEWPSLLQVLDEGSWTMHSAIIVSGFLQRHEGEVMARFTNSGSHRLTWRREEDGWPTMIFSRGRRTCRPATDQGLTINLHEPVNVQGKSCAEAAAEKDDRDGIVESRPRSL